MSELDLTIGWPLALWGLCALPLLILLVIRSRFPIGPRRRAMVLVTRLLAVALLVLAIADLRYAWPTDELSVATVIDGSPSVSAADRARVRQLFSDLAAAHEDVRFIDATSHDAPVPPAMDVSVGVATLPRDRVRRMIVATDGRDRHLGAAIAGARRAGVEVSVVAMGDEPPIDLVSVRGLSVPRMIRAGDRLDVGVELHASRDASVHLVLALDGAEVASREAVARRGAGTVNLEVEFPEEEGVHELTVAMAADGDPIAENNRWRTLVRISPKPLVRILHDPENGPPVLARVLDEGGMRVEVVPITAAPTHARQLEDVNLVIVDEANPNDLTEEQQVVLRDWVQNEGGGLISVTGRHPVRRSPEVFRQLEPITIPPAIPEPRPLELVLVIDRSSSMSGIKMMQARNAAVAAIQALRADARVGVVAFSGGADRVMAPVGMDQRQEAINFVQGIHASGGTNIAAALGAANRIMSSDPRYIRHVILLSDGVSAAEPALAEAQAVAARGISITAITIGPRNDLMQQIAQIGRGRYHVTNAAGSLPSLFVREAQFRQPPAHRRVSFRPRLVTSMAMLEGVDFDAAPQLSGYALSSLRRGATLALAAPDRRPALAHWHRGLGQVATWTSATSGPWADDLRGWEGFRRFWVGMAEGMLRTRPIQPPQVRLAAHPLVEGVEVATVIAPTVSSDEVPVVRIFREAQRSEPLELVERGPGVWQSEILEDEGFLLDARMPVDERPTVAVGHDRPYDPELAVFGADHAELARLAAAGGGRVLDAPGAIAESVEEEGVTRTLRTPLLAAALGLYLLGLLLLRLPDHSVGATVTRAERSRWGRKRRSLAPDEPRRSQPPDVRPRRKEAA
ncbi:MAG: VWA domain-containing protein [Sandaracinaceae bacterium]|nr:VWA domain-containing protein [Sandaracinaceae bacterium]